MTTKLAQLKESKESAELLWFYAQTISQLVYAGYTPQSVIDAVTAKNLKLLKAKKQERNGH